MYIVEFEDVVSTMSDEQLLDFIKIAVIRNKDISHFAVHRIVDVHVDDYGHPSYITA